jgi:hypothetical protein
MGGTGIHGSNPKAAHRIREEKQKTERRKRESERLQRSKAKRLRKKSGAKKVAQDSSIVLGQLTHLLEQLGREREHLRRQEKAVALLALNNLYRKILGKPLLLGKEIPPLIRDALGGVITTNELQESIRQWENHYWARFRSYLNSPHSLGELQLKKPKGKKVKPN